MTGAQRRHGVRCALAEALLPSTYMELVKTFEDYNYSVKSPELAAGSWCNMVTEEDPVDEKRRGKFHRVRQVIHNVIRVESFTFSLVTRTTSY